MNEFIGKEQTLSSASVEFVTLRGTVLQIVVKQRVEVEISKTILEQIE